MTRSSSRKRRSLFRMFAAQDHGICCYCDGKTWLPGRESKAAARARLGIPVGVPGCAKMLTAARATEEHLVRVVDGGGRVNNLKMACHACNGRRGETDPETHRANMLRLVAAGLHPTNRPAVVVDPRTHLKQGLKALRKLRAGVPLEEQNP